MKELVLKKCLKCGALVEILQDCTCENCGIKCCGEEMQVIKPNSVDAIAEKHVPNYEVTDNYIVVTVNHVMDEDHFIEWVALSTENTIGKKFFAPGGKAVATFPYVKGSKIYAYCNKHGLWKKEIE